MRSVKPTRKAFASPGASSGMVTVAKVWFGVARKVSAASSRLGDTPWTTPRMIMKAIGVKAKVWASQTPNQP